MVAIITPDQCSEEYLQRHVNQPTHFPRHVKIDPTLPLETADSVFVASDRWNSEMEADVFDVAVAPLTPKDEVKVIQMKTRDPVRIGSTSWNTHEAVVEIRDDFVGRPNIDWLLVHELGHAINLLHEENDPDSWMHSPSGPNLSEHSKCLIRHALEESEELN